MDEGFTKPPFKITEAMLAKVATISELVGRIAPYEGLEARPHLRKNNRIRSIHSSLAIEANSLSLEAVRDVINGNEVVGPAREIQEVKNAYRAYEALEDLDPYSVDELKRVHGLMTEGLVGESGVFRAGGEGVFDGERLVFMAPPPEMVPRHIENLFSWLKGTRETLHPLIASSVFHYEFVFIHPFADGNGRMARLWQTALLAKWRGVFRYVPIESHVHRYQDGYYAAIDACNKAGESTVFVEFMLERIAETLEDVAGQVSTKSAALSEAVKHLLEVMDYDVPYTAAVLLEKLGLKSKEMLRKNYLDPALAANLVVMTEPGKPTSRNQRYIRK